MFFFSYLMSFTNLDFCMNMCFYCKFCPWIFSQQHYISGPEKQWEMQKVYYNSFIANYEAKFVQTWKTHESKNLQRTSYQTGETATEKKTLIHVHTLSWALKSTLAISSLIFLVITILFYANTTVWNVLLVRLCSFACIL